MLRGGAVPVDFLRVYRVWGLGFRVWGLGFRCTEENDPLGLSASSLLWSLREVHKCLQGTVRGGFLWV